MASSKSSFALLSRQQPSWRLIGMMLLSLFVLAKSKEDCNDDLNCQDHFEACHDWFQDSNSDCDEYMQIHCAKTCDTCDRDTYLHMGVPQYSSNDQVDQVKSTVEEAYEYLKNEKIVACKNEFRECAWFASSGHCSSNPALMSFDCAPVCKTCAKHAESKKHAQNKAKTTNEVVMKHIQEVDEDKWETEKISVNDVGGKLTERKRTIVSNSLSGRSPFTIQTPKKGSPCSWSDADNMWQTSGFMHDTFKSHLFTQWYHTLGLHGKTGDGVPFPPPYLLIFNNFISMAECKYLIDVATNDIGWNSGTDTRKDLTYDSIMCGKDCQEDVIIKSILKRIELITGTPMVNMEYVELRRYQNGGHQSMHHDYIAKERNEPQGVRHSTFYLPLTNDAYDGDTSAAWYTPGTEVSIAPKAGRALWFINVRDEDVNAKEPRMEYEIKPADVSVQYALVTYLHQRNYQDTRNCPVKLDRSA